MFKDDYKAAFSKVTASGETYRRVMQMTQRSNQKHRSVGGTVTKLLVAAIVVSLLAVTAAAAAQNWFVPYFSGESESGLSQEQVNFIEQNEQHIDQSQTQNGWTMELRSAISDGTKGYIMLGVTAPADVDLEAEILEKQGYCGPRNDYLPKSPDAVLTCSAGLVGNIGGDNWRQDGDGLKNTLTYVIPVTPDPMFSTEDPFGKEVTWHIHFVDIVQGFPEQETLAEGTWDFDFTFEIDKTEIELLKEPMKTQAFALLPDGTERLTEVTATSFVLRPFGATVSYGDASDEVDYTRTNINFTDSMSERTPWFVVMKDGTKMELMYDNTNPVERYVFMEVQSPIVLKNVDYILLADGTRLPMPE